VRFSLLGRVTVHASGRTLPLGPPRQRAVLAYLLLRNGHVVPITQLVDALWGTAPASTARTQVHAAVSGLRAALGGEGLQVINTRGGSYLIDVADEDIDVCRFGVLMAEARQAMTEGACRTAAASARTALQLWRGPALADVTASYVEPARTRLEEERQAAYEVLFDAELHNGHHAEVATTIAGCVEEYPLREKFVCQLMLALYRCGRQADALAAARNLRRLLAEEHGLDPGSELKALELAVLNADPALDPVSAQRSIDEAGRSPGSSHRPNQLPMALPDFVGRDAELAEILGALRDRPTSGLAPALVSLSGLAGAGKTALATQAARQALSQFPDGCIWADLHLPDGAPTEPYAILGSFLRALGVEPAKTPDRLEERRGLFRSITADRRLLVILDDAYDEAQVRQLLPGDPGCAMIVTSRRLLVGLDGAHSVVLGAMRDREAWELLVTTAGRSIPLQSSGANRVLEACAGLPLALRIAGARLRYRPGLAVPELAQTLSDERSRLDGLRVADRSVRASLMLTYRELDSSEQRLLCLLANFPGSHFTAIAGAALAGRHTSAWNHEVQHLIELHMIEEHTAQSSDGQARYRLHDLVRLFAVERSSKDLDPSSINAAMRRLFASYQATLAVAAHALLGAHVDLRLASPAQEPRTSFADHHAAMDWFATEHDNMRAMLKRAVDDDMHQEGWRLAAALQPYYRAQHLIGEWLAALSCGLACAEAAGDRLGQLILNEQFGLAYIDQRQYALARRHLFKGLRLAVYQDDQLARGRCLDNIGVSYGARGNLKQAEIYIRRALAVPAYAAHPRSAASAMQHLGLVQSGRNELDAAAATFREVLKRCLAVEDWRTACLTHHNLAEALLKKGLPILARKHLNEELRIAQERQFPEREARAYEVLGDSHAQSEPSVARDFWHKALGLYRNLAHENTTALAARLQSLP
jgi:DNA-binding SARP family transcriptional activator/tetratricopeptide (TPR) repeat protein